MVSGLAINRTLCVPMILRVRPSGAGSLLSTPSLDYPAEG